MTIKQTVKDKTLVAKLMSNRTGRMKAYQAILLVSIGNQHFEGETLKAAITMINEDFKSCCIVVADTLQRHNIATEKQCSTEQAYGESLKNGHDWLKRYEVFFLKNFKIPYEIIRWDDLINSPEFSAKKESFSSLFNSNLDLQQAMALSIEEYSKRLQKRLGETEFNQIASQHHQGCSLYLQEECIAISLLPKKMILISDNEPSAIVYPGKSTAILTQNREIFIKREFSALVDVYEDFLNWLPYRFNKINNSVDNLVLISNSKTSNTNITSSKEIDLINHFLETQLYATQSLVSKNLICEFNSFVLCYLLDPYSLSNETVINFSENSLSSSHFIAYIFSTQILAMLNTLEKKIANQGKANLVRILKRMIINKDSDFKGSVWDLSYRQHRSN